MRANRTAITLMRNEREETRPGVWEDSLTLRKVKARKERVFQRRRDQAMLEGLVINARFKVRSDLIDGTVDYVEWRGARYKVHQVIPDDNGHYVAIEIGEMV